MEKALCRPCHSNFEFMTCSSFCDEFYEKCKNSFFEVQGKSLKGCSDDSTVCSQLKNIFLVNSASKLCAYFGLKIEEDEEEKCYNGVPDSRVAKKRVHLKSWKGVDEEESFVSTIILTLLAFGAIMVMFWR